MQRENEVSRHDDPSRHGRRAEQPPWWVALVAVTPALVVFVLPAVAAVHFGRRALRSGDVGARVPMALALTLAAGFVLLDVISGLAVWLS